MNDKERLQRIKEDVSFWEYCLKNTHWCELVSHDIEKIKWLIERVEQLQQEQKRLKNQMEKQFQRAQAEAERYKNHLLYIQKHYGLPSEPTDFVPVTVLHEIQMIVNNALEGES